MTHRRPAAHAWRWAALLAIALAPGVADAFGLNPWWVGFPDRMPPDTPPYGPPRRGANHQMCHWDLRQFEGCRVPWCMGRFSTDMNPSAQLDAIEASFQAWEDVEPARIGFRQTAPGPSGPAGVFDRYNKIGWVDSLPKGLIGMTIYWADRLSGHLLEADIMLNEAYTWIPDPPEGSARVPMHYGVKQVATHEIGHFIGLGHTAKEGPDYDFFPFGQFPGGWDIDANGDGIYNRHIMLSGDDKFARTLLQFDDRDGCNFLYDVDLGDAPDPYSGVFNRYPSLVHGAPSPLTLNGIPLLEQAHGAEHLFGIRPRQKDRNYLYEWLGSPFDGTDDADGECEANVPDLDKYDDGLKITPNPPVCGKPFELRNWVHYSTDDEGNHHWYAPSDSGSPMIVRTWLDFDRNAKWESSEIVIHQPLSPMDLPNVPNLDFVTTATGNATLPVINGDPPWYWIRTRLDWVEDDSPNWDRTLNGPEGAASLGEVEDYPITCQNPRRQHVLRNDSGSPARALVLVVPGQGTPAEHYEAFVSAGDCPVGAFQGATTATYDPLADVTVIRYSDPGGIPPGTTVHVGLGPSASSTQVLRAYWEPELGSPGVPQFVPTTNVMVLPGQDEFGAPVARVVVGTVNTAAGGVLFGDPGTATWQDSMHVDVTARVAASAFPLAALSECNPLLTQLPAIPLGSAWIRPDRPLRAVLPADLSGRALVLEVNEAWSVNAAGSLELLQLDRPLNAVASVEPSRGFSPGGLRLSVLPNPAARLVVARFALPSPGRASLRVYDVRGALVRTLLREEWLQAGEASRLWDGLDSGGRLVPAGAYFLRLESGGMRESRVAILRH